MTSSPTPRALLMAGSPSDLDLVLDCQEVLDALEIESDIRVLSAHRTPDECATCAREAEKNGFEVIIAFAGMAAHLGGVAAAHSRLPVIQVPVRSGALQGVDAALASLQMPPGTPLAAVAIGGAKNAGLLAARMMAIGRPELRDRMSRLAERDLERYAPEKINEEIAKRKRERRER